MKKKITLLLIIFSIFLGLATPRVGEAACFPGLPFTGFTGQGFNLPDCAGNILATIAVPIAGKAVDISARLFDFSIRQNMELGKYVVSSTEGVLSPVETIWKIIRDMSGMFFIFILIYASIQIILNGTNAKNAITGVVIAALLVNFSLFFTKLIVDFSNTITLTIYSAIVPDGPYGLSDVITSVVSLQSLFTSSSEAAKSTSFNISIVVILFCAVATMIVMSIMFLAGAVMFLWRFIMLICLMAFSPFWAISKAIPQVSEYGDKFFKTLVGQAAFAPVFLFFIYIGMKILTDVNFIKILGTTNNNLASVFGEANGFIGPLFQYGLVIFIMFSGLGMASRMGGKGGEFGIRWMTSLGKWGQGVAAGVGRGAVRNTFGMAASKIADSDLMRERARKSTVGMMALKGLKAGGSYFEEATKKSAEGRSKDALLLGYNKNIVGGYEKNIEENLKQIDREKMQLEDPALTIDQRKAGEQRIKDLESINRSWKKDIDKEKLRRQIDYARRQDPSINIETGERVNKTLGIRHIGLGKRTNIFGFISGVNEQAASEISLRNLEEEIKSKEETIKKINEKRDEVKKDMTKRKNELSKTVNQRAKTAPAGFDKKAELERALHEDGFYSDKRGELHKILSDNDSNNNKGLISHEAELRALKNAQKNLKS